MAASGGVQWYYIDAEQNYVGPVDTHGLQQLRAHNYVSNDTYIWSESLTGWEKLAQVDLMNPGAKSALPPAMPRPAAYQAPAQPAAAPIQQQQPTIAPQPTAAAAASTLNAGRPACATVSCASGPSALPTRGHGQTVSGAAAGAALPSLGIARKRQGTVTAQPTSLGMGGGGGVLGGGGLAAAGAGARPTAAYTPAAAPTLKPNLAAPTLKPNLGGLGGQKPPQNPAAAAPPAGVHIPTPAMADRPGGEWDESYGMRILIGSEKRVRAIIKDDGEVSDALGTLLAYIESNGEVGDAQMNYAGKAHMQALQVIDHVDIVIGEYDPGRGYIKDAGGSVVAELNKEGTITDNGGQSIGVIEGFAFRNMAQLAAYFLIVDPGFVRSRGVSYARR